MTVVLREDPQAQPAGRHAGLYHYALLYPSREELARAAVRLAATSTPIQGASDHRTHEAIYLPDADGNGIELAADRPREAWPQDLGYAGGPAPLDVEDLLGTIEGEAPVPQVGEGLRMGHLHLHVGDIDEGLRFYRDVLGFEVQANLGSAAFVSAGGYHHHLGFNIWNGHGAGPPPRAPGRAAPLDRRAAHGGRRRRGARPGRGGRPRGRALRRRLPRPRSVADRRGVRGGLGGGVGQRAAQRRVDGEAAQAAGLQRAGGVAARQGDDPQAVAGRAPGGAQDGNGVVADAGDAREVEHDGAVAAADLLEVLVEPLGHRSFELAGGVDQHDTADHIDAQVGPDFVSLISEHRNRFRTRTRQIHAPRSPR